MQVRFQQLYMLQPDQFKSDVIVGNEGSSKRTSVVLLNVEFRVTCYSCNKLDANSAFDRTSITMVEATICTQVVVQTQTKILESFVKDECNNCRKRGHKRVDCLT